jgi:ubiquinone biosynthesis protein COQ9
MRIDDKYNLEKKKKPETKAEILQEKIEELVKQRDAEKDPAAKQALHAQVLRLFAQFEAVGRNDR